MHIFRFILFLLDTLGPRIFPRPFLMINYFAIYFCKVDKLDEWPGVSVHPSPPSPPNTPPPSLKDLDIFRQTTDYK